MYFHGAILHVVCVTELRSLRVTIKVIETLIVLLTGRRVLVNHTVGGSLGSFNPETK